MVGQQPEAGTPPTAPVRLPAAKRREQLLEVARCVLARRGFYETTMAEIADSAGVTKPVLYQHFASKRDLYSAVLHDVGNRLQAAVINAAADADSPRAQVEAGFRAYVSFVETDNDGFRILFSGTSRQDDEWASITSEVEHEIAQGIADLIVVRDISPGHRQALAHGIMGQAEAMMRYWQSGTVQDLERDELIKNLSTLAWGGLRGLEA